jgi:hypothetical protein
MAGDLELLIEFGFSPARARNALAKTHNAGLQAALDWLDKNPDEPTEEEAAAAEPPALGSGGELLVATAQHLLPRRPVHRAGHRKDCLLVRVLY